MKTITRVLGTGMLVAAFAVAGATSASAQATDVCGESAGQDALQNTIRESYASDKPKAIDAGKQLLEKYGSCEYSAEFIAWLKPLLPKWEEGEKAKAAAAERSKIIDRFDKGIASKNFAEVYAAGNEFTSKYPTDPIKINLMVQMGLIGLYESFPPAKNYKFNEDTLRYAKLALNEVKNGAAPPRKNDKGEPIYGGPLFVGNKEDTVSELNYAIGYINYWAKNDRKTALPYYYEAVQSPGIHKDDPTIYDALAGFYVAGAAPVGAEIAKMIETQKTLTTDEEKLQMDADIKAKIALYNGYLERAMDSFARAHKNYSTKTDAYSKTRKDEVYKELQALYKRRFEKDAGLDAYMATTLARPLPNPTSEVTPVVDTDAPAATTTTGGTAASAAVKP